MELAINLCEIYDRVVKEFGDISSLISQCEKKTNSYEISRLYIGSEFCGNYFLHLQQIDIEVLKKYKNLISLVIPVFTQKNLEAGKRVVHDLIDRLKDQIDEIIVNDYGMLEWAFHNENKKIRLGRLFFKELRDPRYVTAEKPFIESFDLTDYNKKIIREYNIQGIELDFIYENIKKHQNLVYGLHYPFTYVSVGQICEFASIGESYDHKFTPNKSCSLQCQQNCISYKTGNNETFIRMGRAILYPYVENKKQQDTDFRYIYTPLDMFISI